ncbi:MAG: 2-oxoglutarate dehydrogenase complex dihydrolipoyllysine-residue succinyltransferase [Alphaproteobacteria bacterium]|nr:2-oxoglutarate dehydrogenase complex dihydrolipoyllysine-residue succinyltransferase [Alphaproteobacteria bacterium]
MSDIQIKVPVLGESVTSAIIAKWYKKVGEEILENDVIVELETDKVTLEVNAPASGVLQQISFSEGDTVNIGDVIGILAEGKVSKNVEESFTMALAEEIADDDSLTAGARKKAFTVELAEEIADEDRKGHDHRHHRRVGDVASTSTHVAAGISPAARKLMEEENLRASDVIGTGRGGRILKEDVLLREERRLENEGMREMREEIREEIREYRSEVPVRREARMDDQELYERKPMSGLRRKIAERLKYAQNTAAILTTFNECDMTTVMALRKTHQDEFVKKYGTKLGFMSFFVKACVQALKDVPAINGEIEGDDIIYHKRYDIGIAVSAPSGLVVPVLRDANHLGLHEVEKAIAAYGEKAKTNKLSMQDLTGGTFTISNGGTFGSLMSTPILNPPQSAILGMHKIQERPMVVDGQIVICPMMYLALSYDHRIIDGREAVTFLVKVKEYVENPSRLLLGL